MDVVKLTGWGQCVFKLNAVAECPLKDVLVTHFFLLILPDCLFSHETAFHSTVPDIYVEQPLSLSLSV